MTEYDGEIKPDGKEKKQMLLQKILLAFFTLLFAAFTVGYGFMLRDYKNAEQYTGRVISVGTSFIDTGTDGYEQKDVIEVDAGARGLLKVEAEAKSGREESLPKVGDTVSVILTKDVHGGDIWNVGTVEGAIIKSKIFLAVGIGCTILFAVMFILSFQK